MECNRHEDFISSDQEDDQTALQDNNLGVGRSYECVFCKRGFNTAQALGGHMNIHRKDRARNKPASINSSKHEENYSVPRFYQQIPTCSPHYAAPHEAVQFNYRPYFPASTSSAQSFYANHRGLNDHSQQRFNPFGDDWSMGLSLPCGPSLVDDIGKNRRVGTQEEELDLELRLGS